MSLTQDIKARRNSCLGIPQKYLTEAFRRNSAGSNLMHSIGAIQNSKQTYDELQEESEKIKNFIKKICSKEEIMQEVIEGRKNSNKTSTAIKKMTSHLVSQFGSSKSVIQKVSHSSSKNVNMDGNTPSNLKRESLGKLSEKEFELQLIKVEDRALKKMSKVSDSEISEDPQTVVIDDYNDTRWVIHPESWYYGLWVTLMFVCIFYISCIDTYVLGFIEDETDTTIILGLFIDVIFAIDLVLNFFLAYYDFDENLILKRQNIILNYLTHGFTIDLLTAIPFSSILNLQWIDNTSTNRQIKLVRIAKLTRMSKLSRVLKLTKLAKIFKRDDSTVFRFKLFDDLNINSNIRRFIRFFVYFIMFNHVSTCIWVFVGTLDYPNWIFVAGLQDRENVTLYVHSLYFNFSTVFTIGYGDITSTNVIERIYNIMLMLVGVMMYSFAITSLSNIVVKIDKKEKNYNKNIELLEEIRGKYRINDKLHKLLKRYLSYDLKINRIDKKCVLDELPQQLRNNLTLQIYHNQIQNLNFFKDAPNEFIFRAVTLFKPLKMFKNEIIIKAGNYLDEMYFIRRGRVLILLPLNKVKRMKLLHFYKNEHFGEIYMCKRLRCPVDLKISSKECELYLLLKHDFIELNEEFPKVIQNFIRKSLANTTKMELVARETLVKLRRENKLTTVMSKSIAPLFQGMSNIFDEATPQQEPEVEDETSPKHLINQPTNKEIADQHMQLIDFYAANAHNVIITEENSSVYYSKDPSVEPINVQPIDTDNIMADIDCKEDTNTVRHVGQQNKVINMNNEKVLIKINTVNSPTVEISPKKVGSQVNINYNINIQNNLNFNNDYFSQMMNKNCPEIKPRLKDSQNITHIIEADNSLSILIDKDMSPISIKKVQPHRRVTIPHNLSTIQKDIDSSASVQQTDSFEESIHEVYEKHRNTPEIKKLRSSSLFDIFMTKYKQRKSISVINKSPQPQKKETALSKFISLRKEDMEDLNAKAVVKEKEFKVHNHCSPKLDRKRSCSFADMKRLSRIHFNDILENMKKDAMVKKNPNGVFFGGINSVSSSKKTNRFSLREQQIDRVSDIYENLIETLFFRMKSRQLSKVKSK
jgi:CRP-like cAMP-binding protein